MAIFPQFSATLPKKILSLKDVFIYLQQLLEMNETQKNCFNKVSRINHSAFFFFFGSLFNLGFNPVKSYSLLYANKKIHINKDLFTKRGLHLTNNTVDRNRIFF